MAAVRHSFRPWPGGPWPWRSKGGAVAVLPRLFGNNVPGRTTRAPPVGFELATNGIQFYAIANLNKTSLPVIPWQCQMRSSNSKFPLRLRCCTVTVTAAMGPAWDSDWPVFDRSSNRQSSHSGAPTWRLQSWCDSDSVHDCNKSAQPCKPQTDSEPEWW